MENRSEVAEAVRELGPRPAPGDPWRGEWLISFRALTDMHRQARRDQRRILGIAGARQYRTDTAPPPASAPSNFPSPPFAAIRVYANGRVTAMTRRELRNPHTVRRPRGVSRIRPAAARRRSRRARAPARPRPSADPPPLAAPLLSGGRA